MGGTQAYHVKDRITTKGDNSNAQSQVEAAHASYRAALCYRPVAASLIDVALAILSKGHRKPADRGQHAAEAYERMMSNKARFRVVLSTGN